ncbi:acyl-CoA dehydrogenase family protein [Shimia thalassica]|uniref:acyl-CoA dehydrogenase family protein n=1 Tax=Shimia thalassica TaxID=1715693 RepID=UPI0026E41A39|nr:acyl-CoA dehydrogenase family protein [Shimia thalassica]MDO6483238.1 acyl-CoA dehydrogenase family protein [Shimia thalassica]
MKNPFETEETAAFRETVRRFVEAEITPFVDQWDEAGEIPWALHQKVGALGVFGFGVSEDYGGMGSEDAFLRAAFNEEMAKCGAGGVLAALGGRVISIGPIHDLANAEIKDCILADIVAGRKGSALGITEPSGGSDVANLKTTARKDGNHYVLNGSKAFITGGMTASHFVVGARTGGPGLGGISLFLVDAEADGFSRTALERKMGWWASDQASLFFDDCRVPATNMLGEENRGFLAIMNNFNFERIAMIAQCIGMMKVCLDESISWAQERETFGKKLIKAQVIRHKIAEISVRIDTCEAYLRQICWAVHNAEMPVAEISKAKFHTSKALEFCASEAMQIVGGAAYLRGHPVERIYREVKVMAIGGGSEEIMRDLAVRQMGL